MTYEQEKSSKRTKEKQTEILLYSSEIVMKLIQSVVELFTNHE